MFIEIVKDFNLKQTFDCGQCFRWNKQEDGSYIGVVGEYVIKASNHSNGIEIDCDDEKFIYEYFDLKRDYGTVKSAIGSDDIIKNAISIGSGIRLLKQNPWETLVSFIISANNNIPRIKKIIELMCTNFGNELTCNGKSYFTFPTAKVISTLDVCDLSPIRCGFRDKYIIDAAKKVVSGELDLGKIFSMNADDGRHYLKQIKGVGDKVADCVLLFAFQKFSVFPKDVWIKKILNNLYSIGEKDIDVFVSKKFGDYGGFAQQYLFYYARS